MLDSKLMKIPSTFLIAAALFLAAASVPAQIHITEWMYNGLTDTDHGEFIEFTNLGGTGVSMSGWSFDDSSRTPGAFDLSAFGTVAPGESVILTEADAEVFRTAWGLGIGVKIIGGLDQNLSRSDELNLYDNSSSLIDRLTFSDAIGLGPRTQNVSGITTPPFWGANDATAWQLSSLSDGFSFSSTAGDTGNPGILAIPEPSVWALFGLGAGVACWRRFRKA